jgi:Plasmid pRiA4b ORF-3-like protein
MSVLQRITRALRCVSRLLSNAFTRGCPGISTSWIFSGGRNAHLTLVVRFYNLLEAIGDPEHEEHDELLDWLGGSFDPEAFSVDEVNRQLEPRQRHRKAATGRK